MTIFEVLVVKKVALFRASVIIKIFEVQFGHLGTMMTTEEGKVSIKKFLSSVRSVEELRI